MANFLDGVNRILRINTIIKGDDDNITTFSDSQHAADISLAQIAIQDEISEIISDRLISYEKTSGTITLLTGTRTYALPAAFVRFYGIYPSFYDSTNNVRIYEYIGGEERLKDSVYTYQTDQGSPVYWYWSDTTSKQIAFYNVPDSTYNNRSLSYDYETSVLVTNSSDTLPFHNNEEYYAFTSMAARRLSFMIQRLPTGDLSLDSTYKNAKSRLYNLMSPVNAGNRYGRKYV